MAPEKGTLSTLFSASCSGCQDLENSIDALVADGERYIAAPLRTDFTAVRSSRGAATKTTITAGLTSLPVVIVNSRGVPVQKFKAESGEWEFQLEWTGAWRVADVRRVR